MVLRDCGGLQAGQLLASKVARSHSRLRLETTGGTGESLESALQVGGEVLLPPRGFVALAQGEISLQAGGWCRLLQPGQSRSGPYGLL